LCCFVGVFARGAETAGAARGFVERAGQLDRKRRYRQHNQLGDALAGFDGIGFIELVDQPHADFAPVVAVDNTHPVEQADAVLDAKAAPGENEGGAFRPGQGNRDARIHHRARAPLNDQRRVDARAQIEPRAALRRPFGDAGAFTRFHDF